MADREETLAGCLDVLRSIQWGYKMPNEIYYNLTCLKKDLKTLIAMGLVSKQGKVKKALRKESFKYTNS